MGLVLLAACERSSGEASFRLLNAERTGLEFENILRATGEFNVFNYAYFFNGGGVAAEDFNKDGLIDLYFTSNMGPNKLFLNEGDLRFRDVTEEAGVAGMEGWTSGVSCVDINNDGLMDIYVSQLGEYQTISGRNQLFVCREIRDGVPIFTDEAPAYGLDLVGFSTQAAFFDYDLDGDLDLYQLNHSLQANGTFGDKQNFTGTRHPLAGDKLMRNDGDRFTDVTAIAGINSTVIGYGLGIALGDVNLDGWPDIYIGNDFYENDYLYLNQGNGSFREVLEEQMMHTSRSSMGVDIADINNDAYPEVISVDALPEDAFNLKSSVVEGDYDAYQFRLRYGYNHQYTRNNLQLNNGDGTFSEIAPYAGVEATDWSWAPLFMDFDNDGFKDLFISNGVSRRRNNIDYLNFRATTELRCSLFCDPILQDCPTDQGCYARDGANGETICIPDASGTGGLDGEPCEFDNVCDPGLVCIGGSEGCTAPWCCTPWCDLGEANTCPGTGEECVPHFGSPPPGLEHVGICVIPE